MAVTHQPVERKRCPLCLAILEMSRVVDGSPVVMRFDGHAPAACEASTLQRIRVLEELNRKDARDLAHCESVINDLGQWVGVSAGILAAGRRWLEHRSKRAADIARLRGAFGTQDRATQHPLWASEEELAKAITEAIAQVEKRSRA